MNAHWDYCLQVFKLHLSYYEEYSHIFKDTSDVLIVKLQIILSNLVGVKLYVLKQAG